MRHFLLKYLPVKLDLILVPLEAVECVVEAVLQHVVAALQGCSVTPRHSVRHCHTLQEQAGHTYGKYWVNRKQIGNK